MKEQRDLTPFQVDELNKKVAKEEEMKRLAEGELSLANDGTKVSNTIWGLLREKAMKEDYCTQKWFKDFSVGDQRLVEVLRTAQKLQGNLEPLN